MPKCFLFAAALTAWTLCAPAAGGDAAPPLDGKYAGPSPALDANAKDPLHAEVRAYVEALRVPFGKTRDERNDRITNINHAWAKLEKYSYDQLAPLVAPLIAEPDRWRAEYGKTLARAMRREKDAGRRVAQYLELLDLVDWVADHPRIAKNEMAFVGNYERWTLREPPSGELPPAIAERVWRHHDRAVTRLDSDPKSDRYRLDLGDLMLIATRVDPDRAVPRWQRRLKEARDRGGRAEWRRGQPAWNALMLLLARNDPEAVAARDWLAEPWLKADMKTTDAARREFVVAMIETKTPESLDFAARLILAPEKIDGFDLMEVSNRYRDSPKNQRRRGSPKDRALDEAWEKAMAAWLRKNWLKPDSPPNR